MQFLVIGNKAFSTEADEGCLADIRYWTSQNKLKLNNKKTEFLVIANKAFLQKVPTENTITIGSECIVAAEMGKSIGVIFDSQLDMSPRTSSQNWQNSKLSHEGFYSYTSACVRYIKNLKNAAVYFLVAQSIN